MQEISLGKIQGDIKMDKKASSNKKSRNKSKEEYNLKDEKLINEVSEDLTPDKVRKNIIDK